MNPFTVSQFVEFLNTALTTAVFPEGVWVEGEVAEYRVSQGKWIWFLLKDEEAVVSCFSTVWQMRQPLEDGLRVRAYGHPKVHAKSGKFSLNVEKAEPVGEGALRRAFELMRAKLTAEGLFATERKRPLPRFPERIGLIASGESAAYGDFLRILGNRWGGLAINHVDVQVQGRDAAEQIVSAFQHFNRHPELAEVVVLVRGGGSLEDLAAFNSEDVARAVFGSRQPVVVGVGHERDETLTDYAADVRASTPTNAAELLVPDRRDVAAELRASSHRLTIGMETALRDRQDTLNQAVSWLEKGVHRTQTSFAQVYSDLRQQLVAFAGRVGSKRLAVAGLSSSLFVAEARRRAELSAGVAGRTRLLQGLDPRRLLKRGYAVVRRRGAVVRDAAKVAVGEIVDVQLAVGNLSAEVKSKNL
ncbi:MAG: exodeoxyribonuclease VII large subunit [Patescibacteria group bacterium]|nr:exodeoxyribonuclease VII large subunit [Patescibacteria group bacterium]